jgi:hypothetical protein
LGQISTSYPQVTHSLKFRRITEFFKIENSPLTLLVDGKGPVPDGKLTIVSVGGRERRLGMRYPSNDAQFIGKYRQLGGQIFETLGH